MRSGDWRKSVGVVPAVDKTSFTTTTVCILFEIVLPQQSQNSGDNRASDFITTASPLKSPQGGYNMEVPLIPIYVTTPTRNALSSPDFGYHMPKLLMEPSKDLIMA